MLSPRNLKLMATFVKINSDYLMIQRQMQTEIFSFYLVFGNLACFAFKLLQKHGQKLSTIIFLVPTTQCTTLTGTRITNDFTAKTTSKYNIIRIWHNKKI